jgi:hypothetical protein
MKHMNHSGWLQSDPTIARWLTLVLMLSTLTTQAWAFREIPIKLPTTITCYDERGGRRVIGGSHILVSDGSDTYRTPTVEMPIHFDGRMQYAQAVKLSIDGNYVFVVGGPDGLYRYDISNRTLKTIRPMGVRASFPAIAVGPDGTLYAGYTGLYRSTDNGDSWRELELWTEDEVTGDTVKVSPRVSRIQISRAGRIFISGGTGTMFDEVLPDGMIKRIGGSDILIHNEVISSYTAQLIRFGKRTGDTSDPKSFVAKGDTSIRAAVAWPDSDTVLAMVEQGGRYTALLFLNSSIIHSLDLGAANKSNRPWIAPSYDRGRRCILFFGLGKNIRIYLDNGEVVPFDIPTEYPLVEQMYCTRDWGIAYVFRYGWCRFDSSGTARYDSSVAFDRANDRLSRRMIATSSFQVFEITESGIDTLVESSDVINSADLDEERNELYWAIEQRVIKTNLNTNKTDTLALTGWPHTGTDTLRQPFSVSAVTVFGGRIFACASTTSTTMDDQANEGLYEFADLVWKFVRGSTDGRRTRVIASGRSDSTVVFAIAEYLERFGYSVPAIVMIRPTDTVASLCPTADVTLSDITSLTTFGSSALFTTSAGTLYSTAPGVPPVEIDLGTNVFAAVEMDRYVAISSGSRGVFLIPKRDLVTNVQDDLAVSRGTGQAEVYPNPVEQDQPLTLSLPHCCKQSKVTVVDLLGREAFSGGFDREASQEGNRYTVTARVPAGHYLMRVSGQTCIHVLPFLVRR